MFQIGNEKKSQFEGTGGTFIAIEHGTGLNYVSEFQISVFCFFRKISPKCFKSGSRRAPSMRRLILVLAHIIQLRNCATFETVIMTT